MEKLYVLILILFLLVFCKHLEEKKQQDILINPELNYNDYSPNQSDIVISREAYLDKLYGFWLGECIANWTGLVTEMDKIGNIGKIKTGEFYTRED